MRVAAYQGPYRPFPAAGGAELVAGWLGRLREQGVEFLCCPEALIGELANESDGDDPATVALNVANGELEAAISPLVGSGMTVIIGFTERADDGVLHNAAAVISDDRLAGIYRKAYPGASVCQAGTELPIFCHSGVPFGVLICNDAAYPEPARVLVARGARLLVVPAHGGHRKAKEAALRARGINVLVARAVENGVPLIAADVAGTQGQRISHGTTVIVDARGGVVARARELAEDMVVADVDLDAGPRGGIDDPA